MATSPLFRVATVTAALAACATGVLALGGGAVATGGLASCISTESYVYTAQKYDPTTDCLNAYAPVEVVNGPGAPATCAAACLTVGEDLYVSTLCPPLPAIATSVPSDAGTCMAALAAAKRGGTCDNPADGGDEADGGEDAGGDDATTDAEPPDAADMDASDGAAIKDASDAG